MPKSDEPANPGGPDRDEMLTIPEAAAVVKVSDSTMYAFHLQGRGPRMLRIGRQLRIRRSDLDSWLEEQVA